MSRQENDFLWFKENYMELFRKYGFSYIAIKDQTVLGAYPSYIEGVTTTLKTEPVGSFIVQECTGDEFGYTNFISSMDFVTE